MLSDGTDDGGNSKRRERDSAARVVTIYRLDEPNVAGLQDVIEWLATVGVTLRDVQNEGKMHFHELVADGSCLLVGHIGAPQTLEELEFFRLSCP